MRTVEGLRSGAPLQEAFRASPRAAVRLLHAGHPDGRDRPPRARARRRARRSSTCSAGHLCRCTGYEPIVEAIAGGGAAMNLALSLLAAAERSPGCGGVPGHHATRELRDRAPAHRRRSRARAGRAASRPCSTTASRPRSSTGPRSGPAPSSSRSRGASSADELDYCIDDCGAARRDPRGRRRCPTVRRASRARSTATSASRQPDALHVRHDRPAEGRPALAPRRPRRRRSRRSLQHGYRAGDRTLGVMPLYHTMGIHSLLAMHLVGGCFVSQRALGPGEALALIEARADHARSTSRRRSSTTSSTTRAARRATSPRCARSGTRAPR